MAEMIPGRRIAPVKPDRLQERDAGEVVGVVRHLDDALSRPAARADGRVERSIFGQGPVGRQGLVVGLGVPGDLRPRQPHVQVARSRRLGVGDVLLGFRKVSSGEADQRQADLRVDVRRVQPLALEQQLLGALQVARLVGGAAGGEFARAVPRTATGKDRQDERRDEPSAADAAKPFAQLRYG